MLEQEDRIGRHQTGRSSGVIHAGIYYEPGSLKARLCVEGAAALYSYCDERQIPYEKSGKLVLAVEEAELGRLDELERRGRVNGVPDLRRLGPDEIAAVEPHARGVAALHSPATGVVDFVAVAEAYAEDVRQTGGTIHMGAGVDGARRPGSERLALRHRQGTTAAGERGLLRRPLVRPAGDRLRRPGRPTDRPLPRRLPAPAPATPPASSGRTSTRCPSPSCPSSAPT